MRKTAREQLEALRRSDSGQEPPPPVDWSQVKTGVPFRARVYLASEVAPEDFPEPARRAEFVPTIEASEALPGTRGKRGTTAIRTKEKDRA